MNGALESCLPTVLLGKLSLAFPFSQISSTSPHLSFSRGKGTSLHRELSKWSCCEQLGAGSFLQDAVPGTELTSAVKGISSCMFLGGSSSPGAWQLCVIHLPVLCVPVPCSSLWLEATAQPRAVLWLVPQPLKQHFHLFKNTACTQNTSACAAQTDCRSCWAAGLGLQGC